MTEDDLEKIKTEKDRAIHILHFSDIDQIDTIYFEKAYNAGPEQGGDKAFELLHTAMRQKDSKYYFDKRTKDWAKTKNLMDYDFCCMWIYRNCYLRHCNDHSRRTSLPSLPHIRRNTVGDFR